MVTCWAWCLSITRLESTVFHTTKEVASSEEENSPSHSPYWMTSWGCLSCWIQAEGMREVIRCHWWRSRAVRLKADEILSQLRRSNEVWFYKSPIDFSPLRANSRALVAENWKFDPMKHLVHQRPVARILSLFDGGIAAIWETTCLHAVVMWFQTRESRVTEGLWTMSQEWLGNQ